LTAAAHTQRALHCAHSSFGWSGKTTSVPRWPGWDTRARAPPIFFCRAKLPHENYCVSPLSPVSFSIVLPAARLLLRARLFTCKRASAVTRWAPSFGGGV
jgi:hypothetical protein